MFKVSQFIGKGKHKHHKINASISNGFLRFLSPGTKLLRIKGIQPHRKYEPEEKACC
jgi:hypothetical protein